MGLVNGGKCSNRVKTFDEASMVHEQLDRVEAEKLLNIMEMGDFLLRRRPDQNLALSLKAAEGVLHIKLERRDGFWVLGEGPRFASIGGMIKCYRKTELPVRGTDHFRLNLPLTVAEAAFLRRSQGSP